jgi:hypothetical protein
MTYRINLLGLEENFLANDSRGQMECFRFLEKKSRIIYQEWNFSCIVYSIKSKFDKALKLDLIEENDSA